LDAGSPIPQLIELMAINRNAYPCREIEMAERLTGEKPKKTPLQRGVAKFKSPELCFIP
jgi:hypothetical protein